jgi:NadR type nicotinamide-nucleotide adenylyltransferase
MLKIAITGPESTGKSKIAEELASLFGTPWVPEFARAYLKNRKPEYTPEMLDEIALGQMAEEEKKAESTDKILFCDTDTTVLKIWCEHAFGSCTPTIQHLFETVHYDFYLLMDIDLPWEPDPLREHPHLRNYFIEKYKEILEKSGKNYALISGDGIIRTQRAIEALNKHLRLEP